MPPPLGPPAHSGPCARPPGLPRFGEQGLASWAPISRKSRCVLAFAICSGTISWQSFTLRSARLSASMRTMRTAPAAAAMCTGVRPVLFGRSALARLSKSKRVTLESPFCTARCSGQLASPSSTSSCAFASMISSTSSQRTCRWTARRSTELHCSFVLSLPASAALPVSTSLAFAEAMSTWAPAASSSCMACMFPAFTDSIKGVSPEQLTRLVFAEASNKTRIMRFCQFRTAR
mmetsp:Transcript_23470/g.44214  ORF Transcript_23470/g.44214 Transcript_23470/m.44214 type:complete len:233 (+) Transcript_23470:228-926(+)